MDKEVTISTIEWQAPEYLHKEKSTDFIWTVGVVTLVLVGIALWTSNYLFAVFIFISGCCLIFFMIRPPEILDFTIETEGLTMGRQQFTWNRISGFNIKKGDPYAKLIIGTTQKFLPVFMILVPTDIVSDVRTTLLEVIPSIEIEESRGMQFMERLGL